MRKCNQEQDLLDHLEKWLDGQIGSLEAEEFKAWTTVNIRRPAEAGLVEIALAEQGSASRTGRRKALVNGLLGLLSAAYCKAEGAGASPSTLAFKPGGGSSRRTKKSPARPKRPARRSSKPRR